MGDTQAEEKVRSIKAILSLIKIDDHHTSRKQMQNALREIKYIVEKKEGGE